MRLAELKQNIEKRNTLLKHTLKDRGVKFTVSTLHKVLGIDDRRKENDDHSMIVVGDKHMSWHENGFSGGKVGKDTLKNISLKQAIEYLQDD